MSLAAASDARKERLLALRRKRAGEDLQDTRYVTLIFFSPWNPKSLIRTSSGDPNQPVLINRTFDPETRTLRKHQTNVEMEDTLESNVKGLAEQIIAEDEAKRAQDLVTVIFFPLKLLPHSPYT
jgi:coiled-coil domain-containing protein 12